VRYQLPDNVRLDDEVPGDLHCRLPEAGLRHALINLILNAAQAIGDAPGYIRLHAGRDERGTVISVCDDGPGLPAALLESGMHDFGSWRPGGTGLGLTTVRRFANHQGGRLELRNLPRQGACATLIFPPEEANG
jgi:two-component system NtrC family sensor kinase